MTMDKREFAEREARFNTFMLEGRGKAKYSAQQKQSMLSTGHAILSPATGLASYPILDHEDVKNAVKSVGLGAAPDDAIRRHIIKNADRVGANHLIPASWRPDGTKQTNSKRPHKPRMTRSEKRARQAAAVDIAPVSYGTEQRSTSSAFKVSDDGKDTAFIDGCAIRYSPTVSQIRDASGAFGEEVMPGALKGADTSDIKFVINHGQGGTLPLARWCPAKKIDTLQLDDRKDGLHFRAAVPLTSQLANDLCVALHTRSIDACSYAFDMTGGEQRWSNGMQHRRITRYGAIHDLSVVTHPAEASTFASVADTSAARAIATAEQEMRSGRVISRKTAGQLLDVHKQLTQAGQLHNGARDAVAGILKMNNMDQGLPDDGAYSGQGPNSGSGPNIGSVDGAGSRGESVHSFYRSIDEILEDDKLTGNLLAETLAAFRAEERIMQNAFAAADRRHVDLST